MPIIDTEKLEAYAQMIFERENQFNTYTLRTIARRIKDIGQLSAYDQESLKNMADISGDMKKITKELARITEMNIEDIEKIYAQVVNDSVNTYKPLYDLKNIPFKPITENDYAMKLVRHFASLTAEEMINLSHTKALGFVDDNGNFTQLAGAFQQTIDDAVVAVSSGTADFNSAMKGTIESLGDSGVQVWYGSGVHRSLEAMVRQNLLWGAKQAAQSYDDYVSEELGLDGFEVDAHSGCRPTHEFMQGKIYSYNGKKVIKGIVYEDGSEALARLKDYGCLHFKTGVLLGVSEPRYSKEELERIHNETTEIIEYDGREKTLYEWKQTQRRLERGYRKAQTQSDMFKESGNNIAAKDYKYKADAIRNVYDDLTNSIPGLYDHSERMRTYFKGAKSLTSSGSGGIINKNGLSAKISGHGVPIHEEPILQKAIDYHDKEAVLNELKVFESTAVNETIEMACVVTKSGKVYKCFGINNRVFPDSDLKEELIGTSVSHNHPIEETMFSFSDADMNLFFEYDLELLRGCDEKYIYEQTRNADKIDDYPLEWANEENYWHYVMITKAKKYNVGYRRWKRE